MERPLVDALHVTQTLPASIPATVASSRGSASLYAAPGARERALPANPTLASFPHEDVDPMRVHAPPSNVSTGAAGVTTTASSSSAVGTQGYVILPRWSPSPLTPRYFASVTHPPPPLGALLTTGTSVEGGEVNHYNRQSNNGHAAGSRVEIQQEVEQSSSFGGLSAATPENAGPNVATNSGMTMSAALAAIPSSLVGPMAISPPATTAYVEPTKKRKRPSGALRLRNFLCTHPGCGKSFTDSAHLRDHTVVHTGEKNLSCPVCDKRFARVSSLREHQRVHTGEKPYVCGFPDCGKCYSSRAALRFHISTHLPRVDPTTGQTTAGHVSNGATPIVPFVCQECGKHFRVRELLMAHRKVHESHRTSALAIASPSPHNSALNATDRCTVAEETNSTSSNASAMSPADQNRHLLETVRAQQQEIEQLKAEVQWLRQQASRNLVETDAPPSQIEEAQDAVQQADSAMKPEPRALTAPVEMLRDGVKPFQCCICQNRFANFYQLTFHGKQHPTYSAAEVTGTQAPLPVGPKYCPEESCEYSEATGKSLRNLQTLKRHWQRRHQNDRPYMCVHCPPTHQKTFKTRENLKAHEKDCMRNLAAVR